MGSVSKTAHGANRLEINVLGTDRAAIWRLHQPDEIGVGYGHQMTYLCRADGRFGSQQPPFHGMGWIEGYIEVIHCYLLRKTGKEAPAPPSLQEALDVMEVLLTAADLP